MKTASTAAVLGSNCDNKTASTATALWTINLHKCTQLLKQSAFLSGTDVCTQSTPHQSRTAYSIRCKISSLVLRHSAISSRKLPGISSRKLPEGLETRFHSRVCRSCNHLWDDSLAVPCWSLCILECKVHTRVCTCPWDVYVCKVVEFDSSVACQY